MQRIILVLICTCLMLPAISQKSRMDTTMVLSSSSETKSVPITVKSGADHITFGIEGEISSGSISVKIYDPNGKKQSGLQLKTSDYAIGTKPRPKSKTKGKSRSGKGASLLEKGDSDEAEGSSIFESDGTSTISISTGKGETVISSSGSGENSTTISTNKNSNSNSNSDNTSTISVSSGDTKTEVGVGSSGKRSKYSYASTMYTKGAKGVLQESIDNPMAGTWRVEIIAEDVSGEVKLEVKQK